MLVFFNTLAHNLRHGLNAILLIVILGSQPPLQAQLPHLTQSQVDLVVIYKRDRLLQLKHNGRVVRKFDIALGGQPEGHKRIEGDGRTPEGVYTLDWRNSNSQFHRSMHISYPRDEDVETAKRWGKTPGGLIMIHGLPNGRQAQEVGHPRNDWTNGCIAVTNEEMDEIWSLVDDGTTIIIFP